MFTTCPNCALNLAVTAADLRVGQGYVRCGRCVSVFNALISLADEAEVGPEEVAAVEDRASATQSRPIPPGLADFGRLDLGETDDIISSPAIRSPDEAPPPVVEASEREPEPRPADAPEPVRAGAVEVVEDHQATGTFETIILEGDTILQTEEFVDEAEVDEQIKALALKLGEHDPDATVVADAEAEARPAPEPTELESAAPRLAPGFVAEPPAEYAAQEQPTLDSLIDPPAPRRRIPFAALACAALGLLLLAQGVHHWRHPLAARLPWISDVYAGIGSPLTTPWRVDAYDVRQLGAAADPADARRVEIRASVRNAAERPQPAPVLRVLLQDRFGNEIGRHELEPADYLRGNALALLAADQRVDATFTVEDPEQKAVGFELDACLPDERGNALRCAADNPLAP
ncbi:MAG: zinc-ribbon and DUF3426 domain-containing protein [Steroidobacteraceae bacterium]